MKRLITIIQSLEQRFFAAVVAMALALGAGCSGNGNRPEDGDKEPEQGYYVIKITPESASVQITPGVDSQTLPFTISGFCHGKHLPPGCDTMEPHWKVSPDLGMQVTINNPLSPDSSVSVRLDFPTYQYLRQSDILGTEFPTSCRFYPSRLPRGMKPQGGLLKIHVRVPSPVEARTEEPAARQRLGVFPESVQLQRSSATLERAVELFYHGPPNQLLPPTFNGQGAADWVVNVPNSQMPGDGIGPIVTFRYIGPTNGFSYAWVSFRTPDVGNSRGISITVPLHRD
jgi:hypothetical protein